MVRDRGHRDAESLERGAVLADGAEHSGLGGVVERAFEVGHILLTKIVAMPSQK